MNQIFPPVFVALLSTAVAAPAPTRPGVPPPVRRTPPDTAKKAPARPLPPALQGSPGQRRLPAGQTYTARPHTLRIVSPGPSSIPIPSAPTDSLPRRWHMPTYKPQVELVPDPSTPPKPLP